MVGSSSLSLRGGQEPARRLRRPRRRSEPQRVRGRGQGSETPPSSPAWPGVGAPCLLGAKDLSLFSRFSRSKLCGGGAGVAVAGGRGRRGGLSPLPAGLAPSTSSCASLRRRPETRRVAAGLAGGAKGEPFPAPRDETSTSTCATWGNFPTTPSDPVEGPPCRAPGMPAARSLPRLRQGRRRLDFRRLRCRRLWCRRRPEPFIFFSSLSRIYPTAKSSRDPRSLARSLAAASEPMEPLE